MTIKQISVFLENKSGRLTEVLETIGKEKINIVRMKKCTGRSDDMLIIRGVNIFPSQIESVLLEMSETKPHYHIVVDRENNLDILRVEVEVYEKFFLDKISQLQNIRQKLTGNLKSALGISVDVKLVEPKTIIRSEGKSVRVTDNRSLFS